MNNSQSTLHISSHPDNLEESMLIGEMVQFLSSLAAVYSEEKTGNPTVSRGLIELAEALRSYDADSSVSEWRNVQVHLAVSCNKDGAVDNKPIHQKTDAAPNGRKITLPVELESLSHDEIRNILEDSRYTKRQIAELGSRRFGISRSSLFHSRKDEALASVRTALDNERSLEIIYEEARRAGEARRF